jgi:hypothetical protein
LRLSYLLVHYHLLLLLCLWDPLLLYLRLTLLYLWDRLGHYHPLLLLNPYSPLGLLLLCRQWYRLYRWDRQRLLNPLDHLRRCCRLNLFDLSDRLNL